MEIARPEMPKRESRRAKRAGVVGDGNGDDPSPPAMGAWECGVCTCCSGLRGVTLQRSGNFERFKFIRLRSTAPGVVDFADIKIYLSEICMAVRSYKTPQPISVGVRTPGFPRGSAPMRHWFAPRADSSRECASSGPIYSVTAVAFVILNAVDAVS